MSFKASSSLDTLSHCCFCGINKTPNSLLAHTVMLTNLLSASPITSWTPPLLHSHWSHPYTPHTPTLEHQAPLSILDADLYICPLAAVLFSSFSNSRWCFVVSESVWEYTISALCAVGGNQLWIEVFATLPQATLKYPENSKTPWCRNVKLHQFVLCWWISDPST